MPFISELERNWKRRGEIGEQMGIIREDGTTFVRLIQLSDLELYRRYTPSTGRSDN